MPLQWNFFQPGGPIVPAFQPVFDILSDATTALIPANWTFLILAGRAAPGDCAQPILYVRKNSAPTYPGSYFQSADGAYWLYMGDARGVNAKVFGAVADGVVSGTRTYSGTDNAPAIQQAMDYAFYGLKCPCYIPAGIYLIATALQLTYGVTLHSGWLQGDGPVLRGEGSFSGTAILCNFSDRPGVAVNGARSSRITGIAFMGTNFHWIESNDLMGPSPALDSTDIANWIDPGLNANANSRYAPYVAIAIDPYGGTRPATHYPDVVYPAWLGVVPQYGKAASSYVVVEDCYIGGFVGARVIQPSDFNSNGDFIKFERIQGEMCAWIHSAGNTQGRTTHDLSCAFATYHTYDLNTQNGRQQGQSDLLVQNSDLSDCIQWLNVGDATNAGPTTFQNCYGENIWRIGNWGGNAGDNHPLHFDGCEFHFTAISDDRGHPAETLTAGSPGNVTFSSCGFFNYGAVLGFGGASDSYVFEQCTSDQEGAVVLDEYEAFARNFTGGGFTFDPRGAARPAAYGMKVTFYYNLSTFASAVTNLKNSTASDRTHMAVAWISRSNPSATPYFTVPVPALWSALDKSAFSDCTLTGSTLSITFSARTDQGFNYEGPLPGDVLWDAQTGSVFFVRSRIGLVVLAELQNNYKVVASVVTPIVSISTSVGTFYCGSSRRFLPTWPTQGDVSSASAAIGNAGRADGFGGYLTTDVVPDDYLYIDAFVDRYFSPTDTKITAVATALGVTTITLSGNGAYTNNRQRLGFFSRQPVANV